MVPRVDVAGRVAQAGDLEPRIILEQVSAHTDEAKDGHPDVGPRVLRDEVLLPGDVAQRRLLLQIAPPLLEKTQDVHEFF